MNTQDIRHALSSGRARRLGTSCPCRQRFRRCRPTSTPKPRGELPCLPSQSSPQPHVDSARYAKVVEVSKRIRWDIDRDVIRDREFDFTKKFLPDGLSFVDRLPFLGADERRLLSQIQGRSYANIFGLVERLHRRQDARGKPRPLARRPERARGAGSLHRRRAEAPGAVSPDRDA